MEWSNPQLRTLWGLIGLVSWLERPIQARVGDDPVPPAITAQDQRYLTQVARRTMEAFISDRTMYEPSYHPASLAQGEGQCLVSIHRHGRRLASGVGSHAPWVEACRNAAYAAVETCSKADGLTPTFLDDIQLVIEAVGMPVPLHIPEGMTDAESLEDYIEPGVDGVVITLRGAFKQFLPSEIVYRNVLVSDALLSLYEQMAAQPAELAGMKVERFRTRQWHETAPGGPVIELHRGGMRIAPEQVTRSTISEACDRIADYMIYRQRQDTGFFSYQYEPSVDSYTDDDNWIRQAGAGWAMSLYAQSSGRVNAAAAARRTLDHLLPFIRDLPDVPGAAFVMSPDRNPEAGLSALTCLAVTDHPDVTRYAGVRDRLAGGLLWLQQADGSFFTAFPPARKLSSQNYFPGETLLALAKVYKHEPQARILNAFDRALPYYRDYFRENRNTAFVAWQIQAFAAMALETKRQDFTDFVYEMTDWMLVSQVDEKNSAYPELWGGIASYRPGRVGVSTASYLEGLTDALHLARTQGDLERTRRYERASRLAARFVLQLQLRPEEAYYVLSPSDAVWAIRTTLTVNLLRIDHCQHALAALMKTRDLVFDGE